MSKNQTYSLDIPAIETQGKNFVESLGADFSFSYNDQPLCKTITILKGKENGILKCFIVQGQISFQIQGKPAMKRIIEDCRDVIIDNTKLGIANKKSYTLREVSEADFLSFVDAFEGEYCSSKEEKEINNDSLKYCYKLSGKYKDELYLNYYKNGTVFAQGKVTPLMLEFIINCTTLLSGNDFINELKTVLSIENEKFEIFDSNLHRYITKNYDKIEGKLETFLKTSTLLANNVIELPDYSPYCLSSLKALEGVLKKRIIEEAGTFTDFGDYFDFDKTKGCWELKENSRPFKSINTCHALGRVYTYFNRNRHPLSHVDDSIETSRTVTYDESVEIIGECLKCINDICINWD